MCTATRPRDLEILTALLEGGFVKPKVSATYPLEEAGHALQDLDQGSAEGKIAVVIVE